MSTKKRVKKKKFNASALLVIVCVILLVGGIGGKLFLDAIYVPPIIMYHSVSNTETATLDGYSGKLNVLPETFARQMKFLHNHKYNVVDLVDLIAMIKNGTHIPRKTVAITFDDGLRNNFFYAYPALKRYNLPATIFVVSDVVGKERFLTLEDIKAMQESGISIGSHTKSHRWLPSLGQKDLEIEISESKKILEKMIGRSVDMFSYPWGAFDERVKKMVQDAGYVGAVATNPGKNTSKKDIFALKRIRISESASNMFIFWIKVSGYYVFIKEKRDED